MRPEEFHARRARVQHQLAIAGGAVALQQMHSRCRPKVLAARCMAGNRLYVKVRWKGRWEGPHRTQKSMQASMPTATMMTIVLMKPGKKRVTPPLADSLCAHCHIPPAEIMITRETSEMSRDWHR